MSFLRLWDTSLTAYSPSLNSSQEVRTPPEPIYVTKTYLPELADYQELLAGIWERNYVTNNGPLLQQLENSLRARLAVPHFSYVSNGTTALQLMLRALRVSGSVITTPYSYVATTNAILWEGLRPVFADIDPNTLCIDPAAVRAAIRPDTTAILATHVYGYPCDHTALQAIANKYGLLLLYDAAHAFDVQLDGVEIGSFGDAAAYSFHATKYFHTIEGGGVVMHYPEAADRVDLFRAFGHRERDYQKVGINGKNSELHAGIGLLNLPLLPEIRRLRRALHEHYANLLEGSGIRWLSPHRYPGLDYNYAYFPVLFADEAQRERCVQALESEAIFPRRYFEPSLNTLPFLEEIQACPVSESVARRVLCLPFYHQLSHQDAERIVAILHKTLPVCASR